MKKKRNRSRPLQSLQERLNEFARSAREKAATRRRARSFAGDGGIDRISGGD
jgi:hypothetical protein